MDIKALFILSVLIFLIGWEYFAPYRRTITNRFLAARRLKNTGFTIINTILSPLIILPVSLFATQINLWSPFSFLGYSSHLILNLLFLDLWIYWTHRMMHEVDFLWRFHQVHHLDTDMDVTSALRFHFAEVILSALFRLPVIILLNIDFTHILIFESLIFACALFQHSNIILSPWIQKTLGHFIVTPNHHWIHHHIKNGDLQKHYATILVIWDRLFGTQSTSPRTPNIQIGVPDKNGNVRKDISFINLIKLPFK